MSYEWPEPDPPEEAPLLRKKEENMKAEIAGILAYLGTQPAIAPVMNIPNEMFESRKALRPITAPINTPLQELAEFTKAEVDAIQDFAKKRGVKAPIISAGKGAYSSYVQANPLAGKIDHIGLARASVPSAMHEIGHASPILGSTKLRDMSFLGSAMSQGSPGKFLRAAILGNMVLGTDENDNAVQKATYEYAPAMIGATYAPMLLEEARATASAVKGGRAIGKGMTTLKDLAPGYGTYVTKAIAPVLAAIVAKKVVEAVRGRGEEKKAADLKASGLLRTSASSAWRMRAPSAKPKTTKPNTNPSGLADETVKLSPPSKTSFHRDIIKSIHNPSRGFRKINPS